MATESEFVTAMGGAATTVGSTQAFSAAAGDYATMASHGLDDFTGPVQVALDSTGTLPEGLEAGVDYWLLVTTANAVQFAAGIANAIAGNTVDLTAVGSGTVNVTRAALSEDFLEAGVDTGEETLELTAHGVETGYGPVQFSVPGGGGGAALPTGLSASTDYWLIVVDEDTVQVATTLANALAGTAINITATGDVDGGTFRCAAAAVDDDFDGETAVTITNSAVTATAHGKDTGFGPVRLATDDTLPQPLATATDYWLIVDGDNTVRLATSQANALAGVAIGIQDAGTGNHTMQATMSTVAEQMTEALNKVLTFPGYRSMPKDVNVDKFWTQAIQGTGF